MARSRPSKKGGDQIMRISGAEFERIIAVSDTTKARKAELPDAQQAVRKQDTAEFSEQAKQITDVKQLLAEIPDVREDRVKELSQKIASGTYKVSNDEIAEMMLRRNTADRVE
jgi:negative regulator of flagellin synthesis FlgM